MIRLALGSASRSPLRNLALEEALLEGAQEGPLLLLYVDSPSVIIGRNQNPWAEVAEGSALPVARRASGGGAVYHDEGNLNWAFVVPRETHDRSAELALVIGALGSLGVRAAEGDRGGIYLAEGGPFAGAKISGTARRFGARKVLHHGTILVSADLARMDRALGGAELESSRALPSAPAPCANHASVLPGLGVRGVAESFARSIAGAPAEAAEGFVDPGAAARYEARLGSWDWTWGATPAFSAAIPGKGGGARIEVRSGLVSSISGPGAEVCSAFLGLPFDYGVPRACALAMG